MFVIKNINKSQNQVPKVIGDTVLAESIKVTYRTSKQQKSLFLIKNN